jgi:exonuclease VII large subunit
MIQSGGKLISSVKQFKSGQEILVTVQDGSAQASIEKVQPRSEF